MPLYDYRCTECDREVEVMHGIHDSGPERCQTCGGAMRKALSPPTIHFKGSGWAKKDAATAATKAKPKGTTSAEATKSDGETKSSSADKSTTEKPSSTKSESGGPASSTAGSETE